MTEQSLKQRIGLFLIFFFFFETNFHLRIECYQDVH